MEFVNLILLISVSQGFVFGFAILFSPFFKSTINKYLGYSILILTGLLLNVYLDYVGVFEKYTKIKVLYDIEWIFLFPVFFFLYIIKSINHDLGESKKLHWLYLPFLFSVVINVIFNLEQVYQWFSFSWEYKELVYEWIFGVQEFAYYTYNFLLTIWAYIILKKGKYKYYPNILWLKRLCIWIFFLATSWIIIDIVDMIFDIGYEIGISIICISASVFIFWVVYYGIYTLKLTNDQKNSIRNVKNGSLLLDDKELSAKKQYNEPIDQYTSFSEDNRYFQKLEVLLKKDCIYRDPHLSQETIAKILNISSGYLSQIVNDITKKNFTAYINSYRIKDVKSMILNTEYDKYSLLAIGLEAGFKSKTTFYTSFKKETGLTPSQFKSKHK
ncbi:helix-turn-helix domain-containing protein [Aquimarina sp. MMG016]|uniref:helix-turn-helix domain-containing protein n=1 Tax=Aquimarina sp. MMG016 TaxID=2822690 RepID=UPI001B39F54F|nr:helix-turn-helix domain-containing protein [Aquimarina sp. MMG016]MBQ4819808.1 AraC family transcriptional regulator [Aquimarina sp. MMG016]